MQDSSTELSVGVETVEKTKNTLDALVENYITGYRELVALGPEKYFDEETPVSQNKLRDILKDFLPVRRAQIQNLIEMSDLLGVPLSPLGLITFTSGRLDEFFLCIGAGTDVDIGGKFSPRDRFKSRFASKVGFWAVQSSQAHDETIYQYEKHQEEIIKSGRAGYVTNSFGNTVIVAEPATPYAPFRFSPKKGEVRKIHDYVPHEGFHATHYFFRPEMIRDLRPGTTVLGEILAYRTGLVRGLITSEWVKNELITFYLSDVEVKSFLTEKIERALKIVMEFSTPEYQALISWRGILAPSLESFLHPTDRQIETAKTMADYWTNVASKRFGSRLLDSTKKD